MLIGVSGVANCGKTYSIRNLRSDKTGVLNIDQKRFAKRMMVDGGEGIAVVDIPNYDEFVRMQIEIEKSDRDYVIVDTFTKLISRIDEKAVQLYGKTFNRWSYYKDEIVKCIDAMKASNKYYVIMMHTTTHTNEATGENREMVKVSGALQKEGGIDGMLDIIVHAFMRNDEDGIKFLFDTQTNPSNNARSPIGMFPEEERFVENDIAHIIKRVKEYYGDE